jgi:membrane protein implicated in regulation of membrane protease activity
MIASPLLWLALAATLVLLSLVGADGVGLLLLAGLAALLLAAVTALTALPSSWQLLLLAALLLLGYVWLRRWSGRRRERGIPPAAGADLAEVIGGFDAEGHGRVRWQGQSWAAVNLGPASPLDAGTVVEVLGREGNRLQVLERRQEADAGEGVSRRTSD